MWPQYPNRMGASAQRYPKSHPSLHYSLTQDSKPYRIVAATITALDNTQAAFKFYEHEGILVTMLDTHL